MQAQPVCRWWWRRELPCRRPCNGARVGRGSDQEGFSLQDGTGKMQSVVDAGRHTSHRLVTGAEMIRVVCCGRRHCPGVCRQDRSCRPTPSWRQHRAEEETGFHAYNELVNPRRKLVSQLQMPFSVGWTPRRQRGSLAEDLQVAGELVMWTDKRQVASSRGLGTLSCGCRGYEGCQQRQDAMLVADSVRRQS
jgi:hypothetical protein